MIASKIIESWKRTLNLEWLCYVIKQRASEINDLQVKWVTNEEKRRKRLFDDGVPLKVNPLTNPTKKRQVETKALEAKEEEADQETSKERGTIS